jgi:hypothetical protein
LRLGHAEVLEVALEAGQSQLGSVGQGPSLHTERCDLGIGGGCGRGGRGLGRSFLLDAGCPAFLALDQLRVLGAAGI